MMFVLSLPSSVPWEAQDGAEARRHAIPRPEREAACAAPAGVSPNRFAGKLLGLTALVSA
jgi:hypothetical protein